MRESWAAYGWGNHVPEIAKTVAKAFYAGRSRKGGNCRTDGTTYFLYDNAIARRIDNKDLPFFVAQRLEGKVVRRPLEFSWAGWFTTTTARHLSALGVNASVSGRYAFFDGKCIDPSHSDEWFTLEEIEHMPPWVDPEVELAARRKAARAAARARREAEEFVQLTGELFA